MSENKESPNLQPDSRKYQDPNIIFRSIRIVLESYATSQPKTRKEKEERLGPPPSETGGNPEESFLWILKAVKQRYEEEPDIKKETERMRSKFKDISKEESEELLNKINYKRDVVRKYCENTNYLKKDDSPEEFHLHTKELVYYEPGVDAVLTAEDYPDTIDHLLAMDHKPLLKLSVSGGKLNNQMIANIYADNTFTLEATFAPIEEYQSNLRYIIEDPIPIKNMKSYELDLITSHLDQVGNK